MNSLSAVDVAALTTGLLRAAFWFVALWWAFTHRRIVATAGFAIVTSTSVIFAFTNSGAIGYDHPLSTYAILAAGPGAALVSAGYVLACVSQDDRRGRWRR